jgi:hypothetical protein
MRARTATAFVVCGFARLRVGVPCTARTNMEIPLRAFDFGSYLCLASMRAFLGVAIIVFAIIPEKVRLKTLA